MVDRGDNTYGGKFVVNPSGGLISKGHPLGATGLEGVEFSGGVVLCLCEFLSVCVLSYAQAWLSAASCAGSCGERQVLGRCPMLVWPCSTTLGWAGL